MLGIDRRAASYVWTAVCIVLLLVTVYLMRKTLFVFIVAVLFAYLMTPLVDLLDRALPTSRTRTPALALAYVIFLSVMVFACIQIGGRVVEQANLFIKNAPELLTKWQQPSPSASAGVNSLKARIVGQIQEQVGARAHDLFSLLPKAGLRVIGVAANLIDVIIVPILAFFFLKDGRRIKMAFLEEFSGSTRFGLVDDLLHDLDRLLAHYMRALMILSAAVFTSDIIVFTILGVPYGLLLAALAATLEFLPMIGPLVAGVMIVLVTALSGGPVLAIVIFLVIYRIFQDYGLSPYLMGAGVELHPLLVLFGVFAGAELAGIPGTFLSVPVLAFIRIVIVRMQKRRVPVPTT